MTIEKTVLGKDLEICRVLNGMWQVAGGHGQIDSESAISDMGNIKIQDLQRGIWQIFTVLQNL